MTTDKNPDLLPIYKKALTVVSKLSCSNIGINITYIFGVDSNDFRITVFDGSHANCTFYFYSFQGVEIIEGNLKAALEVIKTGDFVAISSHAKQESVVSRRRAGA